ALLRRERGDQQVARAARRLERGLVAGVAVVGQQPDDAVLVGPDIPVGAWIDAEALGGQVGAQVAVGLLRRDKLRRGGVQLVPERLVARVGPREGRRMQPFAYVLAYPGMLSGLLDVAGEKRRRVHDLKASAHVRVDARPEPSLEPHRRRI